jgi:hypothetical protein
MARMAPFAENRNQAARSAANEDSPARKSSRKLKGKPRAQKNSPIEGNSATQPTKRS